MPPFKLTDAARRRIQSWFVRDEFKDDVACVEWMGDARGEHWDWCVGTYKKSQVQTDDIVVVDSVEFVVRKELRHRLHGITLDLEDGLFVFKETE
jgi:hypothetical protein